VTNCTVTVKRNSPLLFEAAHDNIVLLFAL